MSDEESFVILGSSPNSIEHFSIIQKQDSSLSLSSTKDVTDSGIEQQLIDKLPDKENSNISIDFKYSFVDSASMEPNMPEVNIIRRLKRDSLTKSEISSQSNCLNSMGNSPKVSLSGNNLIYNSATSIGSNGILKPSAHAHQGTIAANFLMGDIDLNELKEKVYSEFPSLCGSEMKNEEIMKLQNLMSGYVNLIDTLKSNNVAVRQHFSIVQKWQEDNKKYKDEQKKELIKLEDTIAKLNNDNMQLRQDLESSTEHFKLNDESMRHDNDESKMMISEQKSQIDNMRIQIQKLEQQNLATFEYVPKKGKNNENIIDNCLEPEYVSILEHNRIVKNFERQLSALTAKNLDLEDMKSVYIDEITCLKVNLTAAEELLKKNQIDINILMSKDTERKDFFDNYQKERDDIKQSMELLKRQVEIYSHDFQIERSDRENLAQEKEVLLNETKLLQKRNQQLLEDNAEIRRRVNESSTSNMSGSAQRQRQDVTNINCHACPLCSNTYNNLDALQLHVQECIDD